MKWLFLLIVIVAVGAAFHLGVVTVAPQYAVYFPKGFLPDSSSGLANVSVPGGPVTMPSGSSSKTSELSAQPNSINLTDPNDLSSLTNRLSTPGLPAQSSAPTPTTSSTTLTILDCSFTVPAGWLIGKSSDTEIGARGAGKVFEVKTMPFNKAFQTDSAITTFILSSIAQSKNAKLLADERAEPFQGHEAYRVLVKIGDDVYKGTTTFVIGTTRYFVMTFKSNANPLNDSELNGIVNSCQIQPIPSH